jgi:hypothetical protein
MKYVTATNSRKQKYCFKCSNLNEAEIVSHNLLHNDEAYKHVTIKDSSPYVRGTRIKQFDKKNFPSIYRRG